MNCTKINDKNQLAIADPRDIQIGQFSRIGLVLPEDISFDDWKAIGVRLADQGAGWPWAIGDWLRRGERKWGEKYKEAIEVTGKEYQTVARCSIVANAFDDFTRRRAKLSWAHHCEVAPLAPTEQDVWLDRCEAEGWMRADLRKELRAERLEADRKAHPLPDGKYSLLLADPPWKYDFAETDNRQIENHYPTMEIEDICALQPPAMDDCVLFMWATAPKLREALQLLDAWGFSYKTHAIWDKQKIGMGYWFRGQHELMLVATKGEMSPPAENLRVSSLFSSPREGHSKKPECAYTMLESMFPELNETTRCELFARTKRPGWAAWGNEI